MGALMHAWHKRETRGEHAVDGFRGAARALDDLIKLGPQSWNDLPAQTSRDILDAFDTALTDLLAR
jgi:hypothetical protein